MTNIGIAMLSIEIVFQASHILGRVLFKAYGVMSIVFFGHGPRLRVALTVIGASLKEVNTRGSIVKKIAELCRSGKPIMVRVSQLSFIWLRVPQ